jgi:ribosomal protein S27E
MTKLEETTLAPVAVVKNIKNVTGNNMRSSCPSCLSQIEHAQSESQVVCSSCGEIYSPFLTAQDSSPSDFTESALAFKEIIDFGQSIDQVSKSTPETPPSLAKPTLPARSEEPTDFILCTGELGSAYRVTQWHPPLSRMVTLGDDRNPLEKALQELRETAQSQGANAIIGVRCSLSPDNRRALLLGTPVRCEKNL